LGFVEPIAKPTVEGRFFVFLEVVTFKNDQIYGKITEQKQEYEPIRRRKCAIRYP